MPKIPDKTASPTQPVFRATFSAIWLLLFLPSPLFAELLPLNDAPEHPLLHTAQPSLHYEFNQTLLPDEALPLPLVFVGDPVDGLTLSQIQDSIETAANAWNDVACARQIFRWGGFRDTRDEVADEELPIYFQTGTGDLATRIAWTILSPTGTGPKDMAVVLNHPEYRWTLQPRPLQSLLVDDPTLNVAISSVLTHEFGHVLGLAHSTAHNAATMAPRYLPDGSQLILSADDKLGLCQLYPSPGDECTEDAHCPGASCVSEEFGAVCDIPLGELGDYCGLELNHCPDFCLYDEPELGMGYCSETCDSDQDCPDHFVCDTPLNFTLSVCTFEPQPHPPRTGCSTTPATPLPSFAIAFLVLGFAAMRRRS